MSEVYRWEDTVLKAMETEYWRKLSGGGGTERGVLLCVALSVIL